MCDQFQTSNCNCSCMSIATHCLHLFLKCLKIRNMNWLINKKSQPSLENKITIYKAIINPVWTYGIELRGCSKPSNTKILQTFTSKTLRKQANAPWYVQNVTLHDLRIPYVTEFIRTYAKNHKSRTAQNNNQLIRDLFNQPEIWSRLPSTECGQRISLDKLQRPIGGWYLLQIYTSTTFTNYSL
jgi:hypothetical protein